MPTDRRQFIGGTAALGVTALAGCLGGFGDDDEVEAEIGMIYSTGGLGDDSFNDMAQQGALEAEDDLGIGFDETEPDTVGDFGGLQRDFAEQGYDLIVAVGFQQAEALEENAEDFPDQDWIIIDAAVEGFDNVRNYLFSENEGSFQVGHLAGLLTTREFEASDGATDPDTEAVGFVGGIESPLIREFEAGFIAGVEHANPDVDVATTYVGDFADTAGGREAALSMYQEQGVDIIYHAAGATGNGVFQAAEEEGRFAIGVDNDQSLSTDFENVIIASMMKRVNEAVYDAIEDVVNDEFDGGNVILGLAEDGVGTVYGQEIGDAVPDDVRDALEESRQAIIDGDIDVPTEP